MLKVPDQTNHFILACYVDNKHQPDSCHRGGMIYMLKKITGNRLYMQSWRMVCLLKGGIFM
jgi:hypothetical protein